MAPPRVLLIGAYERDNFGDLLFLLQTEHYLRGVEIVAAAPVPADMRTLLERDVPAYGPLLESERFDAIWTVGGEVGATSLEGALRMSLDPEAFDHLSRLPPDRRQAAMLEMCGSDRVDSPYMPRPSAFPVNNGAAYVLNSVGVAGIGALPEVRQAELSGVLREADRIGVRDQASSDLLTGFGVEHTLAPDLVHTLALTRPRPRPEGERPALVQASAGYLDGVGPESFGEALARAGLEAYSHVRLFVAGTAYGHDSVSLYHRVARAYRQASGERAVEISPARRPWDLVDEIADAGLWIGLSLHGRIVSTAYGVPRVGLALPKVDAYAKTWDAEMPFGVELDRLADAVAEARSAELADRLASRGVELAHLAEDTISAFARDALELPADARYARRLASLEGTRIAELGEAERLVAERDARLGSAAAQVAELRAELGAAHADAAAARTEVDRLQRQLVAVETELRTIRASRAYRVTASLAAKRRAVLSRLPRA